MIHRPDWDLPATIRAFYTCRQQGQSRGQYAGFNLGMHVGDDQDAVAQNRQMLPMAERIVWLNQVHSAIAIEADFGAPIADADASFTSNPGTVCAVMTADCLPVLVADTITPQVAAIHAGWRGLAAGVIENTLAGMRTSTRGLTAWIGPAISQRYFEIGAEVKAAFAPHESAFFRRQGDKYYADLAGIAAARLYAAGIRNVVQSGLCSFALAEQFYSYRRDGQTGRMVCGIYIDPHHNIA